MRILLASSSPRRIELLKNLGFDLVTVDPNIEEILLPNETAEQMVCRLAKLKAQAVATKESNNLPIIAADTTVSLDNHVLNKPKDKDDAIRMLKMLSGKTHEVLTGYAVITKQTEKIGLVKTKVIFRDLKEGEILSYVETGEPLNKAGAYAIQGSGVGLIDKVIGSMTNVMGLPIKEVLEDLYSIS